MTMVDQNLYMCKTLRFVFESIEIPIDLNEYLFTHLNASAYLLEKYTSSDVSMLRALRIKHEKYSDARARIRLCFLFSRFSFFPRFYSICFFVCAYIL